MSPADSQREQLAAEIERLMDGKDFPVWDAVFPDPVFHALADFVLARDLDTARRVREACVDLCEFTEGSAEEAGGAAEARFKVAALDLAALLAEDR